MTRTMPREDLEYKHVLADMGADGALGPRLKTTYYHGMTRIIVFEHSPPRPVLEIQARTGGGITLSVLDPSVPMRVSMEGETYDLTAETSAQLEAV